MIVSQKTETWLERSMVLPVHKKKKMKNIKAFEEFNSAKISESKDDLIQAIKDIRAWVEDERDSKKYKGLLSNID